MKGPTGDGGMITFLAEEYHDHIFMLEKLLIVMDVGLE
jgi:hypothetical protein